MDLAGSFRQSRYFGHTLFDEGDWRNRRNDVKDGTDAYRVAELRERDDDASDVVVGAALQGQRHQLVRAFLRIGVADDTREQVVGADEVGQAVAGQYEAVAGQGRERTHLGRVGQVGTAEKLVEDVAIGTLPCLFGSQRPIAE